MTRIPDRNDPEKKEIRAVIGSYIALDGIPTLVALGAFAGYITSPDSNGAKMVILLATISILWALWLRGFRLTVTDEFLEYRNGFYRTTRIPLKDVAQMRSRWFQNKKLGQTFPVPRIFVIAKDRKTAFIINDKPFGIDDLKMIRDMVKAKSTCWQSKTTKSGQETF